MMDLYSDMMKWTFLHTHTVKVENAVRSHFGLGHKTHPFYHFLETIDGEFVWLSKYQKHATIFRAQIGVGWRCGGVDIAAKCSEWRAVDLGQPVPRIQRHSHSAEDHREVWAKNEVSWSDNFVWLEILKEVMGDSSLWQKRKERIGYPSSSGAFAKGFDEQQSKTTWQVGFILMGYNREDWMKCWQCLKLLTKLHSVWIATILALRSPFMKSFQPLFWLKDKKDIGIWIWIRFWEDLDAWISHALDAMSYFKYIKREPTRFVNLVDTLRFGSSKTEHERQLMDIKVFFFFKKRALNLSLLNFIFSWIVSLLLTV